MEQLLTKAEVCEMFQISESTLNRILERRELPHCKIGGSVRFKAEDLSEYVRANTVKVADAAMAVVSNKPVIRKAPKFEVGRKVPEYYPGMKVV